MILKLPTSISLSLLLIIAIAASAAAQKRQTPAKTQPSPAATPAPTPPPPTFDTLLGADTYRIYGEVRSVGQFIKSNSVNEILEPILKLAGPPKEFRTVIRWLNTHADEVMSSRLLFAGWNSSKDVPDALVAIEFASPEEATKFQQQLNPFLQKMLPASSPTPGEANKVEPVPQFFIQQSGSLILVTPTKLNVTKLRPAGSKLLAEDVNFRVARNRFNTESLFVFVDMEAIQKEEREQLRKSEEEHQKAVAEQAKNPKPEKETRVELIPEPKEPEEPTEPEEPEPPPPVNPEIVAVQKDVKAMGMPSPVLMSLGMLFSSIFNVEAKWPAAMSFALSLEGESFDLRALLVNAPGEKSDAIPFLPVLATANPITPEAPSILPADTEMLVTVSLDLPHIYDIMARPIQSRFEPTADTDEDKDQPESPIAALEKQLKIKIKDDLLPLMGSEIVVSVPMTGMDWLQPPRTEPRVSSAPGKEPAVTNSPSAATSSSGEVVGVVKDPNQPEAGNSVVVAISLKDKEGMRAFLPKLIESVAFKGASALSLTERREDTELVSYANTVAYAFIGNFLIISPDVASTRHVVDSYLKHETLASEPNFKNYTRWQPRQVQGQVYLSPALMESYRKWVQQPTAPIDEQTRALLTRFSIVSQPVTYSLSNEGFGPFHELHLPKNLVLLLIAATSGAMNTPPVDDTPPATVPPPPPTKPTNPF